jgi:hypothetical protein
LAGRIDPSIASLLMGQSVGNSAMQALEFRPAHLHRDIIRADGGICNEIQFDPISLQNRSAAYRSIDEPPSHVDIRRALIQHRPVTQGYITSRRMMEWKVAVHESRKHKHQS